MKLIEWVVAEDLYQEQIIIPKKIRNLAKKEGISTKVKDKVSVVILNLSTGESYSSRLAITGTNQLYLPVEVQKMLKGSKKIRIQIL
jgi:ribosomal protein L4